MNPKEKIIYNNKIYTIEQLENKWRPSEPRYSEKELLVIFPEAQPYLEERLIEFKKKADDLAIKIQKKLKKVYQNVKDEFAIWFNEEIIKTWYGDNLNKFDKEIRRLGWLLNPEEQKREITPEMIERAKNYPFQNLLPNKKNFALCHFHNEKKPSFYIKNNWGYCYGCGWHGDTIKFLMDENKMSFVEAIKYLN